MITDLTDVITRFYCNDEYIFKNPSLHTEDTEWKVNKIIPFINKWVACVGKKEISILDIGGGSGQILSGVSSYITTELGLQVNKFALDLSPGMIRVQKENNPDLKKILNEDVRRTSLKKKEIDLSLMIDVLEHVPSPNAALKEVSRVSHFALLKVPLEDCILHKSLNLITGGKRKRTAINQIGHINFYNFKTLKHDIEENMGQIMYYNFTNVAQYYAECANLDAQRKAFYKVALCAYGISPVLCSHLFHDFAMFLVKCA